MSQGGKDRMEARLTLISRSFRDPNRMETLSTEMPFFQHNTEDTLQTQEGNIFLMHHGGPAILAGGLTIFTSCPDIDFM